MTAEKASALLRRSCVLLAIFSLTLLAIPVARPGEFTRGEANQDGETDLSDAVGILVYLFAGRPLDWLDAADVDDSGALDVMDAVSLLKFLYEGDTVSLTVSPVGLQGRKQFAFFVDTVNFDDPAFPFDQSAVATVTLP